MDDEDLRVPAGVPSPTQTRLLLLAVGEHERALSLAVESPQRLCSWAFHSLPRDLVPRALAVLEPHWIAGWL